MNRNIHLWLVISIVATTLVLAGCGAATESGTQFPTGKFLDAGNNSVGYIFTEDKTWQYLDYGSIGAEGTFEVKGNQWINNGDEDCPFDGIYEWTFDGTNLTFKLVGEDKCDPRRGATDGKTFVLATQGASLPEIKIDAADFSYTAPEKVDAGWVRVILTNSGAEPHHVQFLRLNDGVALEQFQEALKQGEVPALALVKQVGGVGAVAPGGSGKAVINLPEGEYVILCFVPSPSDHVPHLAKGMIKSLIVEAGISTSTNRPTADLTVTMKDFTFDLPETLPAGEKFIKVINDGPEPHELNILRLEEGKSVQDVLQFLNGAGGPPPFTPVGGINGLDMGLTGYIEFDFQPGTYVAICNIPSPKAEGHPHFTLGMVKEFTVQ